MLKLAIACVIFGICSYVGFEYGEGFNRRIMQLKEVLKGLIILQNDILYGSTPLPEAFENFSYKVDEPIHTFINEIRKKLVSGSVESVYDGVVDEYMMLKGRFSLKESDIKILGDFFRSLGESGAFGQERIFSLAIEGIRMNLRDAEDTAKRNVKLYRYLGVCLGGMITIFVL